VWKDPFQYSSLSAGRPGTASAGWIYMHFEGRLPQTRVARFNLSWLMAGEPTGDGEVPVKPVADQSSTSSANTAARREKN